MRPTPQRALMVPQRSAQLRDEETLGTMPARVTTELTTNGCSRLGRPTGTFFFEGQQLVLNVKIDPELFMLSLIKTGSLISFSESL